MLSSISLTIHLQERLISIAFKLLNGRAEAIAVKAFSLKILGKALAHYPELKAELLLSMDILKNHPAPALISQMNKIYGVKRKE